MNSNRSKYGIDNSKFGKLQRTWDGITFDSKLECRFYKEYILQGTKNGKVRSYKRQVKYELQPTFYYEGKKQRAIEYRSDFDVTYSDGSFAVIDVKGFFKPMDNLKAKMFRFKYPELSLVFAGYSKSHGGFINLEKRSLL